MKIHYKEGQRIAQFGSIKIECTDKMMSEILAVTNRFPTLEAEVLQRQISDYRSGKSTFFEYCMTSCAKLKIGQEKNTFYIYCYDSSGKDGKVSVAELKMLNGLRIALIHHNKMNALLPRRAMHNDHYPLKAVFD